MKNIVLYITFIFICFITNAQDQITNSGNLQIHTGSTISFFGNFANNGTFTDAGTSISFNGTSNQAISGSTVSTFYDLVINNAAGVTMQQAAIVGNILTLTSGALDLNSKTLTINNNSSSAITRTSGYIVSEKTDNSSKLKWNISSNIASYTFPFGTVSGTYIPFILNHTAGDIGNVTVATYHTAVDNTPYPSSPDIVTNVNDFNGFDNSANTVDRFWQIDKTGPAGTATLTFTAAATEVGSISNLGAQRWNNILLKWDNPLIGQSNTVNSATVPGVTSFSPWTLLGNGSFLPITMLSFTVSKNNNYAALNWVTASETNNNGFDVEKSLDLKIWNKISFVEGAGNSNQLLKYNYDDLLTENIKNNDAIVYYRLKQIDFNGVYKYSDIRSLNLNAANQDMPITFALYPNPASQYINIVSSEPIQNFQINIYNSKGAMVSNTSMNGSIQLDISNLSPAAYNIVIIDKLSAKQYQFKMVKIPD